MEKLISVDILEGRGPFYGPHGTGVVDLELEPWKSASLTVRYGPSGYGAQAKLQQRSWDDPEWTTVAGAAANVDRNEEQTITVALDPARGELLRWSAQCQGGVIYVAFSVSEEGAESE
jgi:hypothetical protein